MRKAIAILVFTLVCGLMKGPVFAESFKFDFEGDGTFETSWNLNLNEVVELEIWLDEYTSQADFFGIQLFFQYDPTKLQLNETNSYFNDNSTGGPFEPPYSFLIEMENGVYVLSVAKFDCTPVSNGKILLATLELQSLSTAANSIKASFNLGSPHDWGASFDCAYNEVNPVDADATINEDSDNDTIPDFLDNCPENYNPDQSDNEQDGLGDVCDPDDDNDGICDDCPAGGDGDALVIAAASDDNCPATPNGPDRGTCVKSSNDVMMGTGAACTDDADCANGETCQMQQEDFNLNGIGDACECYADCNNDIEVSILDLLIMKSEYGRNDCDVTLCEADCNGDDKVTILDSLIMKTQYSRTGCPVVQ